MHQILNTIFAACNICYDFSTIIVIKDAPRREARQEEAAVPFECSYEAFSTWCMPSAPKCGKALKHNKPLDRA